ncbi:MAG: reactive intermediate/imine deaminase [Proteobacteria bacterium]|nr:reactive intermediate/imine deaminase [Pseudomonadota bacterium]
MARGVVKTDKAPAPVGPYSQGITFGEILFCAGQIALDPAAGKLVEGDIVAEAAMVVRNLEGILEAGGSGLAQILRLDVFLTDMAVFPKVNAYLSGVFPEEPPARVTVEVSSLPMGARIEIAAIAARKKNRAWVEG